MKNILITGHSFVRRYHDYLNQKFGSQGNYNQSLGLPQENISIFGKGGLKANKDGIEFITTKTKQVKPSVILIELDTNDLAVKAIDEGKQVNNTLHQLFYLCTQLFDLGVRKIVLCEIVNRRKLHGNTTQEEYDRKQQYFNQLLNNLNKLNPDIIIWKHERSKIQNLKDGEISSDNIHITTDHGLKLYNFRIRAALIKGLKSLQQ